jgi:hypothetical protein
MNMNGYDKEILSDGIVVYRLRQTSPDCVDAWFADVAEVFARALETGEAPRLLYDVRTLTFPSRHLLQRAEALNKLPAPDTWRVATLAGSQFATELINLVRSVSLLSASQYARSRVFSDEATALAWLRLSAESIDEM